MTFKKNLPEVILKSYPLTALTEEISREPRTDSVAWLLVAMQISNEKHQTEQGKTQNAQFKEKMGYQEI